MPWQETNAEMERMKFIVALQSAGEQESFAEVCRAFGISRQTGYKWRERFERGGAAALGDRPSLAYVHPNAAAADVTEAVVALRKQRPKWGPKKIRAELLATRPQLTIPAASTIGDILDRNGLIAARPRRIRVPPSGVPASDYSGPNAVWCIDHKGHFPLADGTRCGPLTLIDGYSRYLLRCEVVDSPSHEDTRPHVESAMREYGLPAAMRSDGGPPFASASAPGRLSQFSVWLLKLGIELHRNDPGRPDQNGRLERYHRTLIEEAIEGGPFTSSEQQRRFDVHRRDYNHVRPHEALGQKPPASAYETSWRSFPTSVGSPEYADDRQVRRVRADGRAGWCHHELAIGRPLANEPVFFQEIGDARWDVYFARHFVLTVEIRGDKARLSYAPPEPNDPTRRPPSVRRP